jgi:hypothetical protein
MVYGFLYRTLNSVPFYKEVSDVGKLRQSKEILMCFRFNIILPNEILNTAFYVSH